MRETRQSSSEGGGRVIGSPHPYSSFRRFATLRPQSLLLPFPPTASALHFRERSQSHKS